MEEFDSYFPETNPCLQCTKPYCGTCPFRHRRKSARGIFHSSKVAELEEIEEKQTSATVEAKCFVCGCAVMLDNPWTEADEEIGSEILSHMDIVCDDCRPYSYESLGPHDEDEVEIVDENESDSNKDSEGNDEEDSCEDDESVDEDNSFENGEDCSDDNTDGDYGGGSDWEYGV